MKSFIPPIKKEKIHLNTPFDYFDEIFCINLDSRKDRWEYVQEEFNKMGILGRVKRFPAIQKNNGKLGCYLSHTEIIRYAKRSNLKNVLIFEDDIEISYDFNLLFPKVIDQFNGYNNWHLFYLGWYLVKVKPENDINGYGFGLLEKFLQIDNNLIIPSCLVSTHAYAVNNLIYDKIINDYNTYHKVFCQIHGIDSYYVREIQSELKCFASFPNLISQKNNFSDIDNEEKIWPKINEDLLKNKIIDLRSSPNP
jgi:hypothetical protein